MVAKSIFSTWMMCLCLAIASPGALAQSELRETFLGDADRALAAADAAQAELLAPRNYERGTDAYQNADEGLQRGRNIEYVRKEAKEAEEYFQAATQAAELAQSTLAQVLKSRQDAANAGAPELSKDLWEDAQDEFSDAIRELERGDLEDAKRKDAEATSLYRDAELVAIKAQYLSETRKLIADAERARVDRYAPITLGEAKRLLAEAEKELNENRYDADRPRSLAIQANYEAKHAIHLSEIVRDVRDDDLSVEQLILQWEDPLRQIAGAADVVPAMSNGHTELTAELVGYIDNLRNEKQALEQQRDESQTRLADMEEEIRSLDERLGGATAERAALVQRLAAQERVKQQFERVELMFDKEEARVFREGDNVILRMVGLTFESGQSTLGTENVDLLTKVEKAIDVFPRSEITVEGHTDSYGGDELNQTLSQERAESVQQYMINAMRIPSYRLIAIGYGETNPVANNETEAGRARNRRIDIVIEPNLESTQQASVAN